MEVTKRYSIAYKGLKNGMHDFHFEVDGALFEAFDSTEIKGGACEVEVALQRAETMLTLDVAITGGVVVECDRCLEDCEVPIDFDGQLLVKFSNELQDYDGEVMWITPSTGEVELAQYIYESIVLSLPYQRVHPEQQCDPGMMERFRIVTGEEFAQIEAQAKPEEEQSGQWAELADLKRQMESNEPEGEAAKKTQK